MIHISSENVVSLTEAPRYLPRRRKRKRPHVATMYRWADQGCRGVVLETIQVGGTKCTSIEALQRFCELLTDPTGAAPPKSKARQKAVATAESELDAAGI
jgi:hypothetical protein